MNTHAFEKKLHSLKARFGLQLFVLAAVVCTSWIVTDHANAVYIPVSYTHLTLPTNSRV